MTVGDSNSVLNDESWRGLVEKKTQCQPSSAAGDPNLGIGKITLIKQWHLDAGVNSFLTPKVSKKEEAPQLRNQEAIFNSLDRLLAEDKKFVLFAEGCQGELTTAFPDRFNGWDYEHLRVKKNDSEYSKLLTSVPLKLKAKWANKIEVQCAESKERLKLNQLAFSDFRGQFGFLTRISELAGDEKKVRPYLQGVRDIFKLSRIPDTRNAVIVLKSELEKTVGQIESTFEQRNQEILKNITNQKYGMQDRVLVIGGSHIPSLKKGLESAGLACEIIEPVGYPVEEDATLEKLKAAIEGL